MKNFRFNSFIPPAIAFLALALCSCKKTPVSAPSKEIAVQQELLKQYANGQIEKCNWNGSTVYSCQQNAFDAEVVIYDSTGRKAGSCNYAFNQLDAICNEITDCKAIYCVKDNIWGKPETNGIPK